jgi:hypothetical protein
MDKTNIKSTTCDNCKNTRESGYNKFMWTCVVNPVTEVNFSGTAKRRVLCSERNKNLDCKLWEPRPWWVYVLNGIIFIFNIK